MADKKTQDLTTADQAVTSPPAAGGEPRISLVIYDRDESRVVDLPPESSVSVGRREPSSVQISDVSLSRRHARFVRRGREVRVKDLGSRNGTLIDGQRVSEATLRGGDTVMLGNVGVIVHVLGPADAALSGIDTYDRLEARLELEVMRARAFARPLALLLVRPKGQEGTLHVQQYAARLRERRGAVEAVGMYTPSSALLVLPETGRHAGVQRAEALVAPLTDSAQIVCGVALFPDSGQTVQELIGAACDAAQKARRGTAVTVAPHSAAVRDSDGSEIVRESAAMRELQRLIQRVAPSELPVLVRGETGTGKELVAREVHRASPRRAGPLRVVNCAAIPENLIESVLFGHLKGSFTGAEQDHVGAFESAQGGTLFLDEVGELAPAAQAALLRILEQRTVSPVGSNEERAVDVRVVAATHRDLESMTETGSFRLDLFHRLNGVSLELPPLRDRREEIPHLTALFLRRHAETYGGDAKTVDAQAQALLEDYGWPGNVRELRNVIERAVTIADGDEVGADDLPANVRDPERLPAGASGESGGNLPRAGIDLRAHIKDRELQLIREALQRTGGHQRQAADLLRIPLRTLERRIRAHGLLD